MRSQFLQMHFLELLADAFFDNMPRQGESHQGVAVIDRTCNVCGTPSLRAKCEPCFRAYLVDRNRAYRNRKN